MIFFKIVILKQLFHDRCNVHISSKLSIMMVIIILYIKMYFLLIYVCMFAMDFASFKRGSCKFGSVV